MKQVKLIKYNEVSLSTLNELKQKALFFSDEYEIILMPVEGPTFNLMEYVWDKSIPTKEKILSLGNRIEPIKYFWTNTRPLKFDIYYPFATDISRKVVNQQLKQLQLAIDVVKVIKRWDRKYNIKLDKRASGREFIEFFKFGLTDHRLGTLGINYRREVSYKTFILWADKLAADQVISHEKYNKFMEYLEQNSI